jgi:hypothetical protein
VQSRVGVDEVLVDPAVRPSRIARSPDHVANAVSTRIS